MRVFVDFDDVLVNFQHTVRPKVSAYKDPEVRNFLRTKTESWWYLLPKTFFADELLGLLFSLFGQRHVFYLTKPFDAASAMGKLAWAEANLPNPENLIITAQKQLLADDDSCLLIDDNKDHCKAFVSEGGSCFLCDANLTINKVEREKRAAYMMEAIKRWYHENTIG